VRFIVPILLAALVLPAAASAQTVDKSRHLWATVNICDTKRNPDRLGLRASMPGSGRRSEVMYMRFRAQYRAADGAWRYLTSASTDSGWQRVGSARYKARQSGWNFDFDLKAGQRYVLRGVVRYEWRRDGDVVRRSIKRTTAGHGTAFSDPTGYSTATCRVSAD
jgi:hypothetical protein